MKFHHQRKQVSTCFSKKQRPEFFSNFGWPDYLFYLQKLPDPPRNQLVVPKINQEINEPSYEMVDVKVTVTNYGQNNRIFDITKYVNYY
jgi:hypothetical protein